MKRGNHINTLESPSSISITALRDENRRRRLEQVLDRPGLKVEDIVVAAEDNTLERKSQDYTGFKRFLFGSLEALDINVSDYIGQLFSCK